jgi:Fe-S oxidoreductase
LLADVALLPEGGGWLLVEFGAETRQESSDQAKALMAALKEKPHPPRMKLFDDPDQEANIWAVREAALGATAQVPGKPLAWPGWEDSSVPPEKLGNYLRDLRELLDRFGYECAFYGHFGQGCIHTRIDFDLRSRDGIARFRHFLDAAADLVLTYGGSLSGEHGDGQARGALLPKMFGEELVGAFREFKAIWDPDGKMNPGKVVGPLQPDQNLRLGPTYDPPTLKTHFAFPDDDGSFADATLRCVGVGKCRRHEGGVMCPSYMATREEADSTRGRARLLFEMLQGDTIQDGWRSEHVRESLDLCLACKGCKGDCPVHVDMATYKAEFLSHYYAGRIRPVTAYSMGLIYWWARLAAHVPALVNVMTQTPVLRAAAKRLAGISPKRRIPVFASPTFVEWFTHHEPRHPDGARVMLWPDTFNNHFHPETAIAAVEVLETAGFRVELPGRPLCCGRPLYDWGMLNLAKRQLRQILDELSDTIRAGMPVVVLEPSCASVFKDELRNLFPHDEDAKRLFRQTFLFSDFLAQKTSDFPWPALPRAALIQGHCHQKALMGMTGEETMLAKLGVAVEAPEPGCCGMAGAFGFERGEHCRVSLDIGERALLPAVRAAPEETLIIADGFSCREQIAQATGRRPLHLAEVMQMALRNDHGAAFADSVPASSKSPRDADTRSRAVAIAEAGGVIAAVALARRLTRVKRA